MGVQLYSKPILASYLVRLFISIIAYKPDAPHLLSGVLAVHLVDDLSDYLL